MKKSRYLFLILIIYSIFIFILAALYVVFYFRLFPDRYLEMYLSSVVLGLIIGILSYLPIKYFIEKN